MYEREAVCERVAVQLSGFVQMTAEFFWRVLFFNLMKKYYNKPALLFRTNGIINLQIQKNKTTECNLLQ